MFAGPLPAAKKTYVPRPGGFWTNYKKAKACCQFLCDKGAADENHWYVNNVMLPLIVRIPWDREALIETISSASHAIMRIIHAT